MKYYKFFVLWVYQYYRLKMLPTIRSVVSNSHTFCNNDVISQKRSRNKEYTYKYVPKIQNFLDFKFLFALHKVNEIELFNFLLEIKYS